MPTKCYFSRKRISWKNLDIFTLTVCTTVLKLFSRSAMSRRDYSVKPWTDYFEKDEMLAVGKNTFSLYRCGSSGPLILFLHGGGFSGLSWALLAVSVSRCVYV